MHLQKAVVQTKASLSTKNMQMFTCVLNTGEKINIKGKISVSVQYDIIMKCSLDLLVVEGDGPFLMGRDWLSKLKPNLSVFYAGNPESAKGVEKLLDRYADLFKEELQIFSKKKCRSFQRRT